jgi:hypothetical protein
MLDCWICPSGWEYSHHIMLITILAIHMRMSQWSNQYSPKDNSCVSEV